MRCAVILEKKRSNAIETVAIHPDEIGEDAVLSTGISSKGNVPLRIYPSFDAWGFAERTVTYVRVIDLDRTINRIIFRGRVSAVSDVMESGGKTYQDITCVSALDFLEDTAFFSDSTKGRLYDNKPRFDGFIPELIHTHNGKVDEFRQFVEYPESVNGYYDGQGLFCTRYKQLEALLTDGNLRKLDQEGNPTNTPYSLEFMEKCVGDNSALDFSEKFGQDVESPILIGDNLRSIKVDKDVSTAVYTKVIAVSGLNSDGSRYVVDATNTEMQELYGNGYELMLVNDSIKCTGARYTESYTPTTEWQTMAATLRQYAQEEAAKLSKPPVTITIEAEDLAAMGYSGYELFEVGNSYPVVCPPLGLYGQYMRITALKRRLCDGRVESITLQTGEKLSKMQGSSSLSDQIARLNDLQRQQSDSETAQQQIAQTTAQQQTGGYTWETMTQEQYDGMPTHDDRTQYVVDDDGTTKYYIGDQQITSQGGGGTLQTGVVMTDEQGETWIPEHELVPVSFSGSATVYYGGSPARIVLQGQCALFGVAAADIVANDIMSEITMEYRNGTREKVKVYVAWESSTQVRLGVAAYDITGGSEVLIGYDTSTERINRSAGMQIGMVIYVSELYDNGEQHLAPAYTLYLAVKPANGTATLYTMPQAGQSMGGRNADFGSDAEEGYASGITRRTYPS